MSYGWCRTCKYTGYCTFPRDRIVTECDEYEDMDSAPAYDWDLKELIKLFNKEQDKKCSED